MRRFAEGDKVLVPYICRDLPLAEVLKVYEAADGQQALLVRYIAHPQSELLYPAEVIVYVGDRKFLSVGSTIYRVSDGEVVARSETWASFIADLLETVQPPLPGEVDAQSPVTHDAWSALNE